MLNGFLEKICEKRSKAEKVNIAIEFDMFEVVYVPNISFNWQFWIFFYQMNPRVFPAINTVLTLTFGTVNKDIKSKRKFCRYSWSQ